MNKRLSLLLVAALILAIFPGANGATAVPTLPLIGQIGGASRAVVVQGHYAYLGIGARLVILDISNPAAPVLVGQSGVLNGEVYDIAIAGNYAYIANTYFQIVNIADPTNPTLVSTFQQQNPWVYINGYGVAVSGQYAYVAAGSRAFHIVNVADPAHPTLAGSCETADYARDVALSGNYAYVADSQGGLRIINITDPAHPVEVGAYDSYTAGYRSATSVAVSGSVVTVAGTGAAYAYFTDMNEGLRVINVADPAHPTEVGFYDPDAADGYHILLDGSRAYLAAGQIEGLRILSIADPAHPTLLGSYPTPGVCLATAVSGGLAYVADWSGLQIVNVGNPATPTKAGEFLLPGRVSGVAPAGAYVYVSDTWYGLHVISLANSAQPRRVASLYLPYGADDLTVSGSYAYLVGGDGLYIVSIADPLHPTQVGHYVTPNYRAYDVVISGGRAYIADGSAGLTIVNVADPAHPALLGRCDTPGDAVAVTISGGRAYVADRDGGLRIINIADPTHPTEIGHYTISGSARGVAVAGNYAYMAYGDLFRILNVADAANPVALGSLEFGWGVSYPNDVAVVGERAYVSFYAWVGVADITDPANPKKLAEDDLRGSGEAIAVAGRVVYVADGDMGLLLFRSLERESVYLPLTRR